MDKVGTMAHPHVELIKAQNYYGKHAVGWVLLVNGQPFHSSLEEIKLHGYYQYAKR